MKKFAIVLSGCGVYDGAEIHEAVTTMLAVVQQGQSYELFAPDIDQHHVINHLTGEVTEEKRNVLVESARIARGKIKKLSEFKASDYDALIFPGGYGAAKNLSTFAFEGDKCSVNPDVEKAIVSMYEMKKPIGALCISPAVITRVLKNIEVTIGNDANTAAVITKMGGIHHNTGNGEVWVDKKNKIVTTPCYMLDANIQQVYLGAYNLVKSILSLLD